MSNARNIELATEIVAVLADGAKAIEIYPLARQLTAGLSMRLVEGFDEIELETSHPTIDDRRQAIMDVRYPLSDDDERELSEHIQTTLRAWLRHWQNRPSETETTGRKGRLRKSDAAEKKARLLAELTQHPTLVDQPAKVADMVGVSASQARRWINEYMDRHQQRRERERDRK